MVDQTLYRYMIGNLLYLTISRPDIVQANMNPVRILFRYLQETLNYGLWYPKHKGFILEEYIDGDWLGCIDDQKSTSGDAFFLGDWLVTWQSKKQDLFSL